MVRTGFIYTKDTWLGTLSPYAVTVNVGRPVSYLELTRVTPCRSSAENRAPNDPVSRFKSDLQDLGEIECKFWNIVDIHQN